MNDSPEYFRVHFFGVSISCFYLVKPPHKSHQYTSVQSANTYNYLHTSEEEEEEERREREKKIVYMKTCRMMKKPITGNSQPILVAM